MTAVEAINTRAGLTAHRFSGNFVKAASDKMAERMTAERVATKEHDIRSQYKRAEAKSKMYLPGLRIGEPQCAPYVECEKDEKQQRQIKKKTMRVLQDKRERALAAIMFPELANSAGWRVCPESFVIGAAIVIASETEPGWRPKYENGCGGRPSRPPRGPTSQPCVFSTSKQLWRVKG